MVVACKDSFAAAHVLSGYDGKCRNLHGHTYHVEAVASSVEFNRMGMLVDFNIFKCVLHDVLEEYDHAFLCGNTASSRDVDRQIWDLCEINGLKTKFIKLGYSTTENIAKQIKRELEEALKKENANYFVVSVKVSESDKTYATVEG